ncbi:molybdenum cofactor guanylyltransferase [Serinicoccus sp. LYQ131]|uniref:molybdenum cofactor guanylyltransferase n=1 Tax=Serinicoccus sp. LYQ131 TaxID=3378797 RepID=UPI0038535719
MGAQSSVGPFDTPSGMPTAAPTVDLIVLAGGRGERLGGQDKAALVVEGRSLLQRLLAAGPDLGGRVVVVGDTPVPEGIAQTSEEPPGGGPAAGIGAGLDALVRLADGSEPAVWVAVAAVDQPRAAPVLAELRRHVAQLPAQVDALCRRHPDGRRQWLLAIYRRTALVGARARLDVEQGASVRSLVEDLAWRELDGPTEDLGDVDTWEDLARWGGNAPTRGSPSSWRR